LAQKKGEPIAFFAGGGFCFDDDAEFVQGCAGVFFLESWSVSGAPNRGNTFGVVVAVFDINIGFFFFVVFVDEVIVD
jgi:hypothetical protein